MRHASIPEALSRLDAFNRLWRKRRVFLAVFLATIGVAVAALVVLPVRYMATASVIVAEPEPGVANTSPAWAQKIGDPADLESQLLVIRAPRLLRQVMNAPGVVPAVIEECEHGQLLGSAGRCESLSGDPTSFIEYVDTHYAIASAGRSRVINISYQSPLPGVAQRLANALTNAFLDDQRNEGANGREVATSWLWQELQQLDGQIRAADDKIQQFRRNKGLMRGANGPITSERLTSIGQQLAAAEAARAEALARLKEIKSEQERGPSDAPSVLASRTVADLKQQLTTVSAQLASATTVLGPKHPSILALTREQGLIQQRLSDEMQNIANSAQKTFDASDALVTSLKKQMDAAKADAGSATIDEASIESMVRDTEIKRQQYADLYKKASELETERRVMLGSTRLVSLAELPNKPFFPKKLPFLAAGGTLALILGIAAALLADQVYPPLEYGATAKPRPMRKDAEVVPAGAAAALRGLEKIRALAVSRERKPQRAATSGTGTPILARLPRLRRQQAVSLVGAIMQDHVPLTLAQTLDLAEGHRAFRQALGDLMDVLRIGEGEPGRCIVVTSPASGEGRTLTTLALAHHAAAMGCRVLAVECDLQHPAFAHVLSLTGGPGLLGVLAGDIAIRDAVIRTDNPKLDVLVAGGASEKAADRLARKSLAQLLSVFRSYDVVFIDSPLPTRRHARYLSGVDSTLLCMKGDSTLAERMAAAVAAVKALGGSNVAIAATMVEPEHGTLRQPRPVPAEVYARAV
ncbi:exopolysaccharide transport family protein [Bradyrhizobium sp. Tv2a-2]|uniref:exopolysaccharide transport family protein n=1 Tax=Bradyrhizobium sp. Tv2a-2 TaxID=113395 RepID=UPI00040E352B|nr:exopolysaccharide transport family protein [Bradyrhizobium sp. Tv2a-2]